MMVLLIFGLALFIGVHLVKPCFPDLRARIGTSLGDGIWKLVVAIVSVVAIWFMVRGYGAADATPLWIAPDWLRHVTMLLMLPAFMLFTGSYPGSWLRSVIRHPQLAGVKLWAILHLLVNGDLRSLVLFGGLLAWAVVSMIGINRRDGKGPLPAKGERPSALWGWVVSGIVVWAAVFWAHGAVFGVPPL